MRRRSNLGTWGKELLIWGQEFRRLSFLNSGLAAQTGWFFQRVTLRVPHAVDAAEGRTSRGASRPHPNVFGADAGRRGELPGTDWLYLINSIIGRVRILHLV